MRKGSGDQAPNGGIKARTAWEFGSQGAANGETEGNWRTGARKERKEKGPTGRSHAQREKGKGKRSPALTDGDHGSERGGEGAGEQNGADKQGPQGSERVAKTG